MFSNWYIVIYGALIVTIPNPLGLEALVLKLQDQNGQSLP